MSFSRRVLAATSMRMLLVAVLGAASVAGGRGVARAAPAAVNDAATRAQWEAERLRLRGELQRVNAEIDSLKRADRGMRDDYRLRARLADAEAFARRLTELDARLGNAPRAERSPAVAEPRALPDDGPAELEAKADILSDQAHRLATRAESILGRARDLRARQNLRRHVGQMERDPFSPLEGSKRRALASGSTLAAATPTPSKGNGNSGGGVLSTPGTERGNPGSSDTAVGGAAPGAQGQTTPGGGLPSTGATSPSAPSTSPATAMPGTATPGTTTPGTTTSGPAPTGGVAVTMPHTLPSGVSDGGALSVQLRDLLDPATLAEIQRLETSGGANAGFEALERAGAALKARAERLEQQATSLRAREHVAPRVR